MRPAWAFHSYHIFAMAPQTPARETFFYGNQHSLRARQTDILSVAALWIEMMKEHRELDPRVRLCPDALRSYADYAGYHCGRSDSAFFVAEETLPPGVNSARDAAETSARRIIAYVLAYRVRNLPMFLPEYYGFLSDITIAKTHRRRGIGRALVEKTHETLHCMSVDHIQLQVYSANHDAEKFWRRMGYDPFVAGMWRNI